VLRELDRDGDARVPAGELAQHDDEQAEERVQPDASRPARRAAGEKASR
jgi:hypothetical protein